VECPDFVAREVCGHLDFLVRVFEIDRARIHEGIRRTRFEDVLGRSERSELSQMEAAELLGINERTFRCTAQRPVGMLGDRRDIYPW
jgi:hypothetical protein